MSGAPHNHDEHDLALPSDSVREITPASTLALNPEQIAPSEDGWMDPATEAALSVAIEPNTDFTSYETRVAEPLDSSPAMGSKPPASVPIESDWAPIMGFTSMDIFQHSPFGDVLNSLRSLFVKRPLAELCPTRMGCGRRRNSLPTHHPLSSHCRRFNRHARLRLRRHRRYGRRCRRRTRTTAHRALDCHLIV